MKQHTSHLRQSDTRLLRAVIAAGLGVIFLSLAYGFLSTWLGTSIGPLLFWKAAKDIVIAVLALIMLGWIAADWRRRKRVLFEPVMMMIMLYGLVMSLVTLAQWNGLTNQLLAGVIFDTRYLLLFSVMYSTQYFLATIRWRDEIKRLIVVATTVLVVIGILQVTILPADFLTQFGYSDQTIAPVSTIDANPEARRAFATMSGPNDYGAFMILSLAICVVMMQSGWQRWAAIGVAAIGLYISGSRSAWLGAIVAALALAVIRLGRRIMNSRGIAIAILSIVISISTLLYLATIIPQLRLAVFHSSPGDSHLTEGSTDLHWQHTMDGVQRVVANPFGCGLGCAGPASFYGDKARISENYYVQIAEEIGVIGLAIWAALFAVVMRQLYRVRSDRWATVVLASGIGLTVVGFWLHVWADDAVSLMWWGLAGLLLGQIASQNKEKALSLHT